MTDLRDLDDLSLEQSVPGARRFQQGECPYPLGLDPLRHAVEALPGGPVQGKNTKESSSQERRNNINND